MINQNVFSCSLKFDIKGQQIFARFYLEKCQKWCLCPTSIKSSPAPMQCIIITCYYLVSIQLNDQPNSPAPLVVVFLFFWGAQHHNTWPHLSYLGHHKNHLIACLLPGRSLTLFHPFEFSNYYWHKLTISLPVGNDKYRVSFHLEINL